jgi:hypothetical protein
MDQQLFLQPVSRPDTAPGGIGFRDVSSPRGEMIRPPGHRPQARFLLPPLKGTSENIRAMQPCDRALILRRAVRAGDAHAASGRLPLVRCLRGYRRRCLRIDTARNSNHYARLRRKQVELVETSSDFSEWPRTRREPTRQHEMCGRLRRPDLHAGAGAQRRPTAKSWKLRLFRARGPGLKELLFAINQGVDIVGG